MSALPIPFDPIVDDSGALVTGAAVTVASVVDIDGTPIDAHGAVVHQTGANVAVLYDAETKGEAWITLAVSKVGSTFTGLNASPRKFAAKDSSLLLSIKAKTDLITSGAIHVNDSVTPRGGLIRRLRGDQWTIPFVGLGDISSRTKLYFNLKSSADNEDEDSLLLIEETAGLQIVNGEVATTPAHASIVVTDEVVGNGHVLVSGTETAKLATAQSAVYDVSSVEDGEPLTKSSGTFQIVGDVHHGTG